MSARKYTGYYGYRMYLAYYNHFRKESFNVLKYPVARCNQTTYNQLRFRGHFEWLTERYNSKRLQSVMLANFVELHYTNRNGESLWFLSREQTESSWKTWAHRMRHFRNLVLTDSGIQDTMEGIGTVEERFDLFMNNRMSPESLLITMRGTDELNQLEGSIGSLDSFPDYSDEVLFLKKYDMLLHLIDPVQAMIDKKVAK